jgi:hypothetical protein
MTRPTLSSDTIADQIVEEETSSNLVGVIETVISSLDSDNTAMVNRGESGHLWKFKYGTIEVFVQLTGETDEDALTVWSAVLKLPAKDEPKLMRQLLERNWSNTLESRFGIVNDEVVVVTTRSLADLSPSEISRAITIVATIADESDEPLQAEFGM